MKKRKILFLSKIWWSDLLISFPIWNESMWKWWLHRNLVVSVIIGKMSGLCVLRKTWIRRNKTIMAQRKYTKHPSSAPQNTGWVVKMKANTLKLTEISFKSSAMSNYPFKHCIVRTSAITQSEIRTIILNAAWHTPTTSSISKGLTKDSPNSRMYLPTAASRDYLLSSPNRLIQEQVSGAVWVLYVGKAKKGTKPQVTPTNVLDLHEEVIFS